MPDVRAAGTNHKSKPSNQSDRSYDKPINFNLEINQKVQNKKRNKKFVVNLGLQ